MEAVEGILSERMLLGLRSGGKGVFWWGRASLLGENLWGRLSALVNAGDQKDCTFLVVREALSVGRGAVPILAILPGF